VRKSAVSEAHVLDSFAVLALLGKEEGGKKVSTLLRQAEKEEIRLLMTWANLGELAYIVERRWGKGQLYQVLGTLEATKIEFVPVDRELALKAASIKAEHPLAYADAFAAALAAREEATLVTGDPEFEGLENVLPIHWLPRPE
jgi:ribonuclease VapC